MEKLWQYKEYIPFEEMIIWRDEVGVKRGILYSEGKILFEEWPTPLHEEVIDEINSQFDRQFRWPFAGTPHYPAWVNHGSRGIYPPL
jgi:hypothetical protein